LGVHTLLLKLVGDVNIAAVSEEAYNNTAMHEDGAPPPDLDELAAVVFAKCVDFCAPYDSFPNCIKSLDANIDLREPDIVHFQSVGSFGGPTEVAARKCVQLLSGKDMPGIPIPFHPDCNILIQNVKERMGGHDDTGYVIWGASRLLSNLVHVGMFHEGLRISPSPSLPPPSPPPTNHCHHYHHHHHPRHRFM
jgi:hypothetical protein